jgi:hypothetical protein
MQKQAAAGPRTETAKSCITKEDLTEKMFEDNDQACTYDYKIRTASKIEGTVKCTGSDPRTGTVKYEVVNRDKMSGRMEMVSAEGKISVQVQGRWLGADCKDVKR